MKKQSPVVLMAITTTIIFQSQPTTTGTVNLFGSSQAALNAKINLNANLTQILDWTFKVGVVGGLALGALAFVNLRRELNKTRHNVRKLERSHKEIEGKFEITDFLKKQTKNHSIEISRIGKNCNLLQEQYQSLNVMLNELNKKSFTSPSPNIEPLQESLSSIQASEDIIPNTLPPEVKDLVNRFNNQDTDYFRDPRFNPLKLAQESIQGTVGLDGRRVIRLESTSDKLQAYYLEVFLNNQNWLIPNASSMYLSHILNNLSENSEIFALTIGFGKDKPELIRPAKLKSIDSDTWEIAETGEFRQ